jgi:DNA-binding beta-propeller fold protein YncE
MLFNHQTLMEQKMNIQKLALYLLLALSIGWVSCTTDEDPIAELPGDYDGGVFVLNEGNFGKANASLGFYNSDSTTFRDFIYSDANGLESAGDVLQSAVIMDNEIFMVLNGSGKVIVADLKNKMKLNYEITDLEQPRYMIIKEKIAYVTNWVSYFGNGYVAVVDLDTRETTKKIAMGNQPERLLVVGDNLFVSNKGANAVYVVSLQTEKITDTLAIGASPAGMALDADGDLWVLCSGGYDENYSPANNAALVEINTESLNIKKQIALGINTSDELAAAPAADKLYYYSGNKVYAVAISATLAPSAALITQSNVSGFYGMGVSPEGMIYTTDAKDFAQSGEVFRYKADGTFINKFTAGLIPNGFVFN